MRLRFNMTSMSARKRTRTITSTSGTGSLLDSFIIPDPNRPAKRKTARATIEVTSKVEVEVEIPRQTFKQHSCPEYHEFTDPSEIEYIQSNLLSWYDGNKRDLPWRQPYIHDVTSDKPPKDYPATAQRAYEVWVSEIMCQQTQVATVIAYYQKWLNLFPTIFDLAEAPLELVNQTWAGLGYYSRGRRLWEGAKKVVDEKGGILPDTAKELEDFVPGVGRYTAGAIASIAYAQPAEVVDGNVVRVVSRLRALGLDPKSKQAITLHWALAKALVHKTRQGDLNQSLMELGAMVCTPTNPGCGSCPIRDACHAYELTKEVGDIEECGVCLPKQETYMVTMYPSKSAKKAARPESSATCIVEWEDNVLLVQRPATGLLAGLWEFPCVSIDEDAASYDERQAATDEYLQRLLGLSTLDTTTRRDLGSVKHKFSHIEQTYYGEHVVFSSFDNATEADGWKWVPVDKLKDEAVPTGVMKIWALLEEKPKKAVKMKKVKTEVTVKQKNSISSYFK